MGLYIYILFFSIPLIIIYIGIHNCDLKTVKSGFTLFLYMYAAFIGSCIKEAKKIEINKKNIGFAIGLFIVSVVMIVFGYIFDLQTISTVFSIIMACYAAFLIFRTPPQKDSETKV